MRFFFFFSLFFHYIEFRPIITHFENRFMLVMIIKINNPCNLYVPGNYSLSRVLPQIYAVKKEPIHDHVMTLVSLLPQCDTNEKLGLLMLFTLVAKNRPAVRRHTLKMFPFLSLRYYAAITSTSCFYFSYCSLYRV